MRKNVVYWTFKSYALCISETLCADNSQFLYHHCYLVAPGSLHSLLALMHIHALYSFAIVARNPTQPNHEVISNIVYVDFTLSTSLWDLIVIICFFFIHQLGSFKTVLLLWHGARNSAAYFYFPTSELNSKDCQMVKITLCSIAGMINKKVLNNHNYFEMKFWELPKTANWLDYSYNCHKMVNSKQVYYIVNTHIV